MARAIRLPVAVDRPGSQSARFSSVRTAFVLAFLLITSGFPLHAQFFDASSQEGPATITAPWRFHTDDDPQWASPTFDDSQWPLLRMDRSWNVQGYGGHSGYAWYRIRLKLPASEEPLAIGLDRVASAAEIYADGQLIGVMGQMRPKPDWLTRPSGTIDGVPLPPAFYGRTIELAIRAWQSPRSAPRFGTGSANLPRLGTEQAIQELHNHSLDRWLLTFIPDWIVIVVAAVIGLCSLGLFILRPRATEYAWAGLYLLGEALIRGFDFYRQAHPMSVAGAALALESMRAAVTICWLFLVWGFMRARADRFLYTGILLAVSVPLASLLVIGEFIPISGAYIVRALVSLSVGILIFVRLVHRAWRGNRDAQIFLVPFLLYSVMDVIRWIRAALYYAGVFRSQSGLELYRGAYFTVTWDRVAFLLSYLAIGAVLVRRFAQSAQQEQRLATEMEAARQVQAQLVPSRVPGFATFSIETAYMPAAEVGGDFYQVFDQSDGSALIVIGDVSGKGLQAAMTGVLAIGAARTLASEELCPGLLLTRLNREMVGSQNGGFITCMCARITRDGEVALANAGHLPPYRNRETVEVKSGLPLGVTREVEYSEVTIQLTPGDSLTFLSDGVVEARSQTGEMFGFEHTQEISGQKARDIAVTAQRFGQADDITVLTLSFLSPGNV